jgi:hypothetical protein
MGRFGDGLVGAVAQVDLRQRHAVGSFGVLRRTIDSTAVVAGLPHRPT